jgi:CHAT domain-containing protein
MLYDVRSMTPTPPQTRRAERRAGRNRGGPPTPRRAESGAGRATSHPPPGAAVTGRRGWALACLWFLSAGAAATAAPAVAAAPDACRAELDAHRLGAALEFMASGRIAALRTLQAAPGREVLVVADERGNDVSLDVLAADGSARVHADNPVRRAGRQSAFATTDADGALRIRLAGKEHDAVKGRVRVQLYDLTDLPPDGRCLQALRAIAAGDAQYASGQDVTLGQRTGEMAATRHAYLLVAEEYLRAHALLESAGDTALRLTVAHSLAAVYYQDLQDWRRCADWAERAAALATELHRDYDAARARALLAAAWIELATRASSSDRSTAAPAATHELFERARVLLRRLERFHLERGESYDAALQRNNIGAADYLEGHYATAAASYARAARMFGAIGERPRLGVALRNQANCDWGRDDLVAAAAGYRRALKYLTPEPYPKFYLYAISNLATLKFEIGEFDESLRLHVRALALARRTSARLIESSSLYGIGVAYYALGDVDLARRYLEQSLAHRPAELDPSGRVRSLSALSTLYARDGRLDAAIAADEEALTLTASTLGRARMLVHLALDQAAAGRVPQALEELATVLDEPSAADPTGRIEALIVRAHIERLAKRAADAERDLLSALELIRRRDNPDAQFRAELELALTLKSANRPDDALAAVDRALARSDELRRVTASPDMRAYLQEPLRPALDLKLALLAERHRQLLERGEQRSADRVARAALATAESGRAQSLIDLASLRDAGPARRNLQPELARRERLYRDLAARRFRLAERESAATPEDLATTALRAEIASLRLALDALNVEIARRSGAPAGAAPFVVAELAAWLHRLAPGTTLVEYWLGRDDAYAWTIGGGIVHFSSLGPSQPIADAARAMHDALRNATSGSLGERRELAAALYDRILRPLGESATVGHALIVVPDGALNYVSFAALRTGHADSARYLIEDRDVAIAPAGRWLTRHRSSGRDRAAASRFLLVSDPIYHDDDARLNARRRETASGAPVADADAPEPARFDTLRRLPWTARETALVASLLPPSQVDELRGAAATRSRVLALDWTRYRVIHLASHGIVDASMPQLSALVLSAFDEAGARVEQSLRAADLAELSLNADLVVLSACDTALGKVIAGEGTVGLASTAMARGAGAVLASLWQAPDEMSARLMTEFYRGILTRRIGPVAALGRAMRSMLAADREADPAYWAVFQLSISRPDPGAGPSTGKNPEST